MFSVATKGSIDEYMSAYYNTLAPVETTFGMASAKVSAFVEQTLHPGSVSVPVTEFMRIVSAMKKIGGLITFTEWLPARFNAALWKVMGVMAMYWDNLLYTVIFGQNTLFFFRAVLLSLQQGEIVGLQWTRYG